jgi:hypothetical protein
MFNYISKALVSMLLIVSYTCAGAGEDDYVIGYDYAVPYPFKYTCDTRSGKKERAVNVVLDDHQGRVVLIDSEYNRGSVIDIYGAADIASMFITKIEGIDSLIVLTAQDEIDSIHKYIEYKIHAYNSCEDHYKKNEKIDKDANLHGFDYFGMGSTEFPYRDAVKINQYIQEKYNQRGTNMTPQNSAAQ